jgi:2'-5' RNA ligase
MKTKLSDSPEWGSFALVTYIPEPLGSFLHAVRHDLPGEEKPQAHITLLPPRPLSASVDIVSREAQSVLGGFRPFSVELLDVKVFPDTNILYLEIAKGSDVLHKLHDALNTGLLAHDESFDFLPHLTISGPIPRQDIAKIRAQAKKAWKRHKGEAKFEVREVVALWQPLYTSPDDWNRVWNQKLGDNGNSARAGSTR